MTNNPPPTGRPNLSPEELRARRLQLDRWMTWGFLVIGVYTVFSDLSFVFNVRESLFELYTAIGKALEDSVKTTLAPLPAGAFADTTLLTQLGWVSVTIEGIALGLVVWGSLKRMREKKLAWWVPVVGLFASNMIINVILLTVFFGDPLVMTAVKAAIP